MTCSSATSSRFLVIAALLLTSRPNSAAAQEPVADPQPAATRDFDDALARLEEARLDANSTVDPPVLAALATAIADVEGFTEELGFSETGRPALLMAKLSLARGYLKHDPSTAETVLLAILHDYRPPEVIVPIGRFGKDLKNLYDALASAQASKPTGLLRVTCEVECEVHLDAQPISNGDYALQFGRHVLWYRGVQGEPASTLIEIEIGADGYELVIAEPPEPDPPEPDPPELDPPSNERRPPTPPVDTPTPTVDTLGPSTDPPGSRKLEVMGEAQPHRAREKRRGRVIEGLEIMGAVIGVGLIIGGSVFLAFDGNCPNGKADDGECYHWETSIPAPLVIGIGTTTLLSMFLLAKQRDVSRAHAARHPIHVDAQGIHF